MKNTVNMENIMCRYFLWDADVGKIWQKVNENDEAKRGQCRHRCPIKSNNSVIPAGASNICMCPVV